MKGSKSKPVAGSRSSLTSHTFPPFYACYLLQSVKTSRSTATYIGSTPNPPRRIRQHNGELTQGAWKTSRNRPWVMQMIVYGFPSKLAALQFEWAWQHPNVSRHLRDTNGQPIIASDRRSRYLKNNIQTVRIMLSNHPYNLWPLHVKLFTRQAVKGWEGAAKDVNVILPKGLQCSIELEGVDGKSGVPGSGRTLAIDVKDELFTSTYLVKHASILAHRHGMTCSICREPIEDYAQTPLETALCPQSSCNTISHLLCLSNHFMSSQLPRRDGQDDPMVPRGGDCPSCKEYTLWGDVVKGCYRRLSGGAVTAAPEDEDDIANGEAFGSADEEEQSSANDELMIQPVEKKVDKVTVAKKSRKKANLDRPDAPVIEPSTVQALPSLGVKRRGRPKGSKTKMVKKGKSNVDENSDSGEFFDLEGIIASSDDEEDAIPVQRSMGVGRKGRLVEKPKAKKAKKAASVDLKSQEMDIGVYHPGSAFDNATEDALYASSSADEEIPPVIWTSADAKPSQATQLARSLSTLSISSPVEEDSGDDGIFAMLRKRREAKLASGATKAKVRLLCTNADVEMPNFEDGGTIDLASD